MSMYLSIRDDVVFAAGYKTLAEGLKDLNIPGIELFVKKDDTVSAIAPEEWQGETEPDTSPEDLCGAPHAAGVRKRDQGSRRSAWATTFNAEDKEFQVAWAAKPSVRQRPSERQPFA